MLKNQLKQNLTPSFAQVSTFYSIENSCKCATQKQERKIKTHNLLILLVAPAGIEPATAP